MLRTLLFLILIGTTMTATLTSTGCSSSHPQTLPPGSSPAFTSQDPDIARARTLYEQGEFLQATNLLMSSNSDPKARADLIEIMRRRREEYITPAEMLEKVRKDIPDATEADLTRWQKAGLAQSRTIDCQLLYFNRAPQNLYLYCPEASDRRDAHAKKKPEPKWKQSEHLARIIADAEKTGEKEVCPLTITINYTLTIPANRPNTHKGSLVRVWLPFPQEYRQQKNITLLSMSPPSGLIAPNALHDPNAKLAPITGAPQRTVYFEQLMEDPAKPLTFNVSYRFTSYAYYPQLSDDAVKPLPADFPSEYLAERPPHIVFTPEVRTLVNDIVGNESNPLARARKIFYWVSQNVPWCAEEEYCTIPSLSQKALAARRGDCGVQSMTFITLCRCAGIPARWQTCWEFKPLPPSNPSMHDWSEIYIEPWGWLPCDASYGLQKATDEENPKIKVLHPNPKIREFYLGHQDSYRLITNLDFGSELFPPKKSFRSEPCDFQRGEVEIDGRNLYFDEWDYNMDIQTDPKGL